MLQQRKKDFLQRLIEEISKKLQQLMDENRTVDDAEKIKLQRDALDFFKANFEVLPEDDARAVINKIDDFALLEQYARLLMIGYDLAKEKDTEQLIKALSIVDYLENTDSTYSWDRTVLKEDILSRLDAGI